MPIRHSQLIDVSGIQLNDRGQGSYKLQTNRKGELR